jgi:hypothetical protein
MILFVKPKSEAGKGYLRLDKNLFFYDPHRGQVGAPHRARAHRRHRLPPRGLRRVAPGRGVHPKYVGDEKLGKLDTHRIKLTANAEADVAYPVRRAVGRQGTGNLLKRQEFALSGKLLRTTYYPKWEKMFSKSKNGDVYFPREIRIFDEVEKGNRTTVVIIRREST